MEKITLEQALEKGYTHFVEEEGEHIIKLSSITPNERQYYKEGKYFIVDMNSEMYYTISADTIMELIQDYVDRQEEVSDEDGWLSQQVSDVDFSEIAKQLNEKFSKKKWYAETLEEIIF